jgi:hypothetical protein
MWVEKCGSEVCAQRCRECCLLVAHGHHGAHPSRFTLISLTIAAQWRHNTSQPRNPLGGAGPSTKWFNNLGPRSAEQGSEENRGYRRFWPCDCITPNKPRFVYDPFLVALLGFGAGGSLCLLGCPNSVEQAALYSPSTCACRGAGAVLGSRRTAVRASDAGRLGRPTHGRSACGSAWSAFWNRMMVHAFARLKSFIYPPVLRA